MIIPTLVNVRKNSSSSSNAISGAGMLPFITPVFMIAAGSVFGVALGAEVGVNVTVGAEVYPLPGLVMPTSITAPLPRVATPVAVTHVVVLIVQGGGEKVTAGGEP